MIKTLTNLEIDRYINIISNKDSFRNNISIKLPGALDWSLRINLNKIKEIHNVYIEALTELAKKYVNDGKVEGDKIKPEFIREYNMELNVLNVQENEINFRPIKVKDFIDLELSVPEKDFLLLMCEDDDIEKYFNETEN